MRFTANDIAKASKGRIASGSGSSHAVSVSTDSRTIKPGEFFFALRGERFDGHEFVKDAAGKGAAGAVVDRAFVSDCACTGALPRDFTLVEAEDTLAALGALASLFRERSGARIIAVTGSSGKTTTKEMIASILETDRKVLKSEGNFNNLVGLPKTLLRLDDGYGAAVIELGISRPGEMARLAAMARPDVALVTNIGRAHVEGLGSEDSIAREKFELFNALAAGGTMAVNLGDRRIRGFAAGAEFSKTKKTTYGFEEGADVRIKGFVRDGRFSIIADYEAAQREFSVRFMSPLATNVVNGAAAAAAALSLGASIDGVKKGLESFKLPGGRMDVVFAGAITILDDTYNANPESVTAALETLAEFGGRRVAVLGDMYELGNLAEEAHGEVGWTAGNLNIDAIVAVGRWREAIRDGAVRGGMKPGAVHTFTSGGEAEKEIMSIIGGEAVVLFKGSRAARVETLVAAVKNAAKKETR